MQVGKPAIVTLFYIEAQTRRSGLGLGHDALLAHDALSKAPDVLEYVALANNRLYNIYFVIKVL